MNALLLVTGILVLLGSVRRTADHVTTRSPGSPQTPGKARADATQLTRIMLPFLQHARRRRRDDGHAEFAAALLRPVALAGHVQRGVDLQRAGAGAADAAHRTSSNRRDRDRHAARWTRPDPDAVADLAGGGIQISTDSQFQGSRGARDAAADGTGNGRTRRRPDQRCREHVPRRQSGARGDVVAELRLPLDVPADRNLRCVDCHRRLARHLDDRPRRTISPACAPRYRVGFA